MRLSSINFHPINNVLPIMALACSLLQPLSSRADDPVEAGLSLALEANHQRFDGDNADLYSSTLTPRLGNSHWQVGASLPWYRIDGNFYSTNEYPRATTFCGNLLGLSSNAINTLIQRGRLSSDTVQNCQTLLNDQTGQNETTSGSGDISVYINYARSLPTLTPWDMIVGLEYSFDNGDYAEGLGKGSRDTTLSAGLHRYGQHIDLSLSGGYVLVDATDSYAELQNYGYVRTGLSLPLSDDARLGIDYELQQSAIEDLDDTQTLTGYGDLQLLRQWSLYLYITDYLQGDNTPDLELGAELRFSM